MQTPNGLFGYYLLNEQNIQSFVRGFGPGAYALGNLINGTLSIQRIGRSDTNLPKRLLDYLGEYEAFEYGFTSSIKAAFDMECCLYHTHMPIDNFIHPDQPDGMSLACPKCSSFGLGAFGALDGIIHNRRGLLG